MMSPTVALREGEVELVAGSAGSNRIRSAVLQTLIRSLADGMPIGAAVDAPRLHYEEGTVHAEPGVPEEGLAASGRELVRWSTTSLFFGGVNAVARDPRTGLLDAAGDHRRGGAAELV